MWWQLEENRAQRSAQPFNAREQFLRRSSRGLQFFHVGDKATCFYCESKISGHRLAPIGKGVKFGELVKAIVDLDSVKVFRIEGQHFRLGQTLRIKATYPMFVIPTGR